MTGSEIAAAYAMDAVLGDPRTWPHPVRLLGRSIKGSERLIRRVASSERSLRAGGVLLAVALTALTWAATWGLIKGATQLSPWLGTLTALYLAYTTLAARDLQDHALAVSAALERQDLPGARDALSLIVGRDTEKLEEPEVIRAAVETVAENASDGVIAPLLYLAVGGAPLAMAYKTVNTLDSMIGYRDSRYYALGWASARLDDVMNFIPARLTGLLLVVAAFVWRCKGKAAWRIMRRDGRRHPSPNSGVPEAAMAGALGVQLGGMNYYHGVLRARPLLGDALCTRERRHIRIAVKLAWTASLLLLVMILAAKAL
jgi:adenosylcobinamide-phosphate synthase